MNSLFAMLLVVALTIGTNCNAKAEKSDTTRVYAELLGSESILGKRMSVKVSVDLGQPQSLFKTYTLRDENDKDIKFNSMVAAMNYMGKRGWRFVQMYVITRNDKQICHWLMYKDVTDDSEIMEGLHVKGVD